MEYAVLVECYEDLAATSSTHEKRDRLADLLTTVDTATLGPAVRLVQGRVFEPWSAADLGASSSLTTAAVAKATGIDPDTIENWWREAGDLGDAAARAVEQRTQATFGGDSLTVARVHDTLRDLATYEGSGSRRRRIDAIAGLISDATPAEARYVVRTIVGAMRLGVGEGILRDAIAAAFLDGSAAAERTVERAHEVTNDFGLVAERAANGGIDALEDLEVEVFRPIKPMLAHAADDAAAAMADLADDEGQVLLETKYDGIRAKLHRGGDELRVFTRRLEDVTIQFPDVVAAAREGLPAAAFIVEAEVVGYDPETGDPVPFQQLSRRIKREDDIQRLAEEVPVTVYCFDLLYLDGESYLDRPLRERLAALESILDPIPGDLERAAHLRTDDPEAAERFFEDALAAGHEGAMAKNLDATYQPGSRVGYQLKLKTTMEPLDLVVTRAKYSEGRKQGYLGRPYLACRDEEARFREVGRMHTGFTDEQLAEFHELVEPLIESVEGREAELRPEVVLEVEYAEIQKSPTYDSGYALRFPRLSRIRTDLGPEDAATLERVETLYEAQ